MPVFKVGVGIYWVFGETDSIMTMPRPELRFECFS